MQVNTDQYRETKRRLQKESRKAYWQYLENIICYDESIETVQKQKKSGIISGTPKKIVQEWHLCNDEAGHNACPATITNEMK